MEKLDTVILAGGFGTRLNEKTRNTPKPMIFLGKEPIIIHIIKKYLRSGIQSFIICTGYKFKVINNFFNKKCFNKTKIGKNSYQYFIKLNKVKIKIKTIFTGYNTFTGTRLLKIKKFLETEKFFLTYGDGLSDIDLNKLLNFHNKNKKIGTITGVRPPARFGELLIKKNIVKNFKEKPQLNKGWINGGFFVFEKKFINIINKKRNVMLERQPLETLTKKKNLVAFKHNGFWQCMDTLRDYNLLKKMNTFDAPWKK